MVLGVSCRGTAQANDPGLLHQETTDVLCCLFPPGEWRVGPILLRVRPLAAAPLGKRRSTKTSTWRSTVQVCSPTCHCSWSPVTTSLSPAPHTQGMWEEGCSSRFPHRDPPWPPSRPFSIHQPTSVWPSAGFELPQTAACFPELTLTVFFTCCGRKQILDKKGRIIHWLSYCLLNASFLRGAFLRKIGENYRTWKHLLGQESPRSRRGQLCDVGGSRIRVRMTLTSPEIRASAGGTGEITVLGLIAGAKSLQKIWVQRTDQQLCWVSMVGGRVGKTKT